jgi:HAD superfamily hydrolase (TIGR01509 family)
LLDVLGTLVHDPFYVELPAFFGLTLDELIAQKHPTTWIEFETGAIDESSAVQRMFRDGRAVDRVELKKCLRGAYRWLDGAAELLADLRAAGASMHLLSNYPRWYELIEDKLQISRYAAWSFVSCNTGVRKPSPEAFERACRVLGARPTALLFVDDQPVNCRAARRAGIDAIDYVGAEALRKGLAERGWLDAPP